MRTQTVKIYLTSGAVITSENSDATINSIKSTLQTRNAILVLKRKNTGNDWVINVDKIAAVEFVESEENADS